MMLSLDGPWRVTSVPFGADIQSFLAEDFVPEGWLNADIPEEIHATLRKAGVIRGNTYNKRDGEETWIEESDWVYHRSFLLPERFAGQPLELCFDGLDTFCEIYLNGVRVGDHANMFTPCVVDVTGAARPGDLNRLIVRFFSPVKTVAQMDDPHIFSMTTTDRLYARKVQMSYCWDFCGRCVTAGVWKSVSLRVKPAAAIKSYYVYTDKLRDGDAFIHLDAQWTGGESCALVATLSFENAVVAEATLDDSGSSATLTVSAPRLWWPRPYGAQPLYDLSLHLVKDGVEVDAKAQKLGIRTLQVLQEKQPDGLSFQFCVNGKRLFIRGANWVPVNSVFTDITDEQIQTLVRYAAEGNISMLRIWGGGMYESKALFDACDRAGILLWNDFMLACGVYPDDEAFLRNLAEEAEYVVKTYRNATCLALWAGDNENGQAYIWAAREYEYALDPINHRVLKEACERLDPQRFYLPTSPGSPNPDVKGGDNQESPYQGDMHLYIMTANKGVRANRDYGKEYYKRVLSYRPRFVSEFGFVSFPEKDSYYRFNPRREPIRNPSEMLKFLPFTKEYFQRGDMDSVIYFSQVFNAMALKYWIEYFRSLKGTCSGTLYWKFNDPLADCPDIWMYPSHMCAIDMYFKPKMTYYYTRRAYADVLLTFTEQLSGRPVLHLVNETDEMLQGVLRIQRRTFDGDVVCERTLPFSGQADAASALCQLTPEEYDSPDAAREYLLAQAVTEAATYEARYLFADLDEINTLALPAGRLRAELRKSQDCLTVCLRADTYLRNVRLNILDTMAYYEDNYFDMDPGVERRIVVRPWNADDALQDRALYIEAENIPRMVLPICRAQAVT